jgi:hypothetical protein
MAEFNWVEGTTTVKEIVKALATDLTLAATNKWSLAYPESVDMIADTAIIKTTTSFGLIAFLKIYRPAGVLNHVLMTLGNKMNEAGTDIDAERANEPVRFAWYRESTEVDLFQWTAVQYWLSFSADFINVVLQGDPSLDIVPYKNYLISYAYIGALESFEGADADKTYNFGITCSSDILPTEYSTKYGMRTASCITDIGMLGTRTGTPFQAHLPKFSTSWEYTDKNFITSSQWTHKHHMSDIIIYHAYDRERGKLRNVLIGDRSAIFHLDVLVIDKGTETEKQYVMFNINAAYSILNNGPNVLYGIAVRKS